ncbi:MFS transporter [Knoellia sp. 3-2P3]|nr:MFS transporter [Knoellia sp. 3-2P3]
MDVQPWRMLSPLVLATMASQSLLVVLAPTMVAISTELRAPVATVGQARSVTALVSVTASLAITARADRLAVRTLLRTGSALAVVACGLVAASGSTAAFLSAHVLVGLAFAPLLSGGFAGIAAFGPDRRAWATGYVAGANALAWIVVNPLTSGLTARVSWRAAMAVPALIAVAALVTAGRAVPVPWGRVPGRLLEPLTVTPARRWIVSEVTAFAAWTCLLTFSGAYFIEQLGVPEALAGWLLAAGAAAYLAASSGAGRMARRVPPRRLVWTSALVMAGLLPAMLSGPRSAELAAPLFCLIGFVAGIRTPASAGLALEQLPDHPAAMMAARTAATQSGYLVGAVVGGAVLAGPGYGALGVVLAVTMATSSWLVHRVDDRSKG